jgi:hypothetical protein
MNLCLIESQLSTLGKINIYHYHKHFIRKTKQNVYDIQLSKMMSWFKTNGASLSGTNINVLATQHCNLCNWIGGFQSARG